MAGTHKGQNIAHLFGDNIGDIRIEVVVVMPGLNGQALGFMGRGDTKAAALDMAKKLARDAIDSQTAGQKA